MAKSRKSNGNDGGSEDTGRKGRGSRGLWNGAISFSLIYDFYFKRMKLGVNLIEHFRRDFAIQQRFVDIIAGDMALFLRDD